MSWLIRMVVYIALITAPLYVYILLRLTTALKQALNISLFKSRITAIIYFVGYISLPLLYITTYLWGNTDNLFIYNDSLTWQDYFLLYPFWIGVIILAESLTYFIIADLILLFSKIFHVKKDLVKYLAYFKVIIAGVFLIYVPLKSYLDTNNIRLNEYQVNIQKLPSEFYDLQIGLVADIQIDRFSNNNKISQFLEYYSVINTDVIMFAGDIVTSGKKYIKQAVEILCEKDFSYGKYAVLGDHDYWADPIRVENGLLNCNWNFIKNNHRIISYKGKKILITGITHIYSQRINRQSVNELFSKAPEADLKIVLVHQPAEFIVESAEQYGYHLFLAGHTHGGQIVNHIFGFPITPSAFETQYYSGKYSYKDMAIIVSNGIGLSLAPLRYHSPAEISKIGFLTP